MKWHMLSRLLVSEKRRLNVSKCVPSMPFMKVKIIDCGVCEPVCPVNAIFMEDFVPEEEKEFIQKNADFFKKKDE